MASRLPDVTAEDDRQPWNEDPHGYGVTMVTHEPSDGGHATFSPDLTRDVAAALSDYLLRYGPEADAQLHLMTNRVCTEAHTLGLPPEKMLIAIKHLFEQTPLPNLLDPERRRQTYEKFISACIQVYFEAGGSR